jgi:glycosyltransferase involved in cell wall biosynthesis
MRILYDGFIYDYQAHGGINRYFNELIARLPQSAVPIVSTYLGPRENWPRHPRLRVVRSRPFARWPALAGFGAAWMRLQVECTPRDLVHPTYYHLHTATELRRSSRPVVLTVLDMIHEVFADTLDPDGTMARAKAACIERADAILCISEHTRRDLVARFPAVAERSVVTPLASSMQLDPAAVAAAPPPGRPYFLHVGGREAYKNFPFLLRVWAKFHAAQPDVQLHVVGRQWLASERALLAELKIEDSVVHRGEADDAQLALLYAQSLALIYPSLYEGFGIPPLEAMRCGTAVVCSDTSSLPEVCGDAPLYFDPRDEEMLLTHLHTLLDSDEARRACIARGATRATLFSWERTAAQTWEVYRRLADRR